MSLQKQLALNDFSFDAHLTHLTQKSALNGVCAFPLKGEGTHLTQMRALAARYLPQMAFALPSLWGRAQAATGASA